MIKYLFIILTTASLLSCNSDAAYQKKIPGWYTVEQQLEAGKLSGEMTYYKNGALKLAATFNAASVNSISLGITIVMKGTWKVENGFLKENLTEVIAMPQALGDALFAELKKEEIKSKGDEIIEVNKDHLKVKNSKGEITIYKRKQQD
jgi:hypothetical protein